MPLPPINQDAYREALRVAFAAVRSAAERNRDALMKFPNVIDVRPGYKFTDGWITSTPAVVVTVLRKLPPGELGDDVLPLEVDGVPLDVAPATPLQQLQAKAKLPVRGTRGPAPAGAPIPGVPDLEPFLEPGDPEPGVSDTTASRGAGGSRNYKEPKDLKLSAVTGAMTLLCHSSPDAGWASLKPFLGGTSKTLTVAMYDFGAKYIFNTIRDAMTAAPGPFTLNLDRKSNPTREGEFTEKEIEANFRKALKDKFVYSTAAVGTLFPNAYHIKVAVRDGKAFWLSSGNWQGSNQPEDDPFKLPLPKQRSLLSGRNREWHVISDSAKLAQIFEAYIKFDVSEVKRVAAGTRAVQAPEMPELVMPADAEADTRAAKKVQLFAPKKFTFTASSPVKVQPILTPDNYGEHVVKLIKSAQKTLYFQNQYIKIPKEFPDTAGKPGLKDLVEALLDRQEAGVDVKIILRNEGEVRDMMQALKTFGFDTDKIKLLGGCHNKGIVVDSKVVMVSSQNYSADGVRFNRDAGLIIFNAKVAKFYEEIFLYDWNERAISRVAGERGAMPQLVDVEVESSTTRPRGGTIKTRVMAWEDYYQD